MMLGTVISWPGGAGGTKSAENGLIKQDRRPQNVDEIERPDSLHF
jgi:hypothetical protein